MKCKQDNAIHVNKHNHRGAIGRELLFGLVTAFACSLLWAVITHYSGRDLTFGMIGIGILVGIAVACSAKARSIDNGISAAGLTAIAVLLGKLIIVQWGLTAALADPTINIQASAPIAESSQTEQVSETADQSDLATVTDSEAVPRIHAAEMQDISRIKSALTINDLLWLVGAAVVAFIVGIVFSKHKQTTPTTSLQDKAGEKPATDNLEAN